MLFQDSKSNILQSKFGVHENVCFLFSSFNDLADHLKPEEFGQFIFESQTPKYKYLHKKYVSIMNPEKFEEQKAAMKAYDTARDKTPKRKERHKGVDHNRDITEERQARDKTNKRKEMHKVVDHNRDITEERQARDKTSKRKEMHKLVDQDRDKTPKR